MVTPNLCFVDLIEKLFGQIFPKSGQLCSKGKLFVFTVNRQRHYKRVSTCRCVDWQMTEITASQKGYEFLFASTQKPNIISSSLTKWYNYVKFQEKYLILFVNHYYFNTSIVIILLFILSCNTCMYVYHLKQNNQLKKK